MKSITLKRTLSLGLAIIMILAILSITSCGKQDNSDVPQEPTQETEAETLTPEQNKFANSLGGVSETFKGAVSENNYNSSKDAATAFVKEEVVGKKDAEILTTKSTTLDDLSIAKLNIPSDILNGSDEVQKVEVTYKVKSSASTESEESSESKVRKVSETSEESTTLETLNKEEKVSVYVIKFNINWKYFAPKPVTGNTISKSYYDSVFNAEKYKNCTLKSTSDATVIGNEGEETINTHLQSNQTIKHANGKIYLEDHYKIIHNGITTEDTIYAYMETSENGSVLCYIKDGESSEWCEADIRTIGFSSLEQLTPFYDQYLDYTYFTKTQYGFALEKENAVDYFSQAMSDTMGSIGVPIKFSSENLDMYAEYYVSNGVLSGARVDASLNLIITQNGESNTIKETTSAVTTCTDYGTTVVEKPFAE